MNDATPPVIKATSSSPGVIIVWAPVPLAVEYSICRETPPSTTCVDLTPTRIPSGALQVWVDQTTPVGRNQIYRVTGYRQDQHFGVSQPSTPVASGGWPAPGNFRIAQDLSAQGELILAWDPITYSHSNGASTSLNTYLIGGTGLSSSQTVTGTQMKVTLSPGVNQWQVSAAYPDPAGGIMPSTPATISYDYFKYRLVALGVRALKQSTDDLLDMDGKADEIYVASVAHVTTRTFGTTTVAQAVGTTYGDVGSSNNFPGRVQAGTASGSGGIRTGDLVPLSLDLSAPAGSPNSLGFPLLLWEGALDPNAMVVVFPTIWEDDNNKGPFGGWQTEMTRLITAGYDHPTQVTDIAAVRDADALGPAVLSGGWWRCVDPLSASAANPAHCTLAGRDRPLGLYLVVPAAQDEALKVPFVLLTRSAIDKALASPPPRTGAAPGVIVVPFHDTGTVSTAMYELYLRVERIP